MLGSEFFNAGPRRGFSFCTLPPKMRGDASHWARHDPGMDYADIPDLAGQTRIYWQGVENIRSQDMPEPNKPP